MATITFGHFALTVALTRRLTDQTPAQHPGLAKRLRGWLRHRRNLAELAEADERACRDLGLPPPSREECLRSFRTDPTTLWSIGEVPMPSARDDRQRRR